MTIKSDRVSALSLSFSNQKTFFVESKTVAEVYSARGSAEGVGLLGDLRKESTVINCTYSYVESENPRRQAWDEWNRIFLQCVRRLGVHVGAPEVGIEEVLKFLEHIPPDYTLKARLKSIRSEVFDDGDDSSINAKSFVMMLRYLPIIERNADCLGFYVDELQRIGLTISRDLGAHEKRLDLLFKETGEVLFTYVDLGEGVSRISGSSYLTEYLSNSRKIKKLFDMLG